MTNFWSYFMDEITCAVAFLSQISHNIQRYIHIVALNVTKILQQKSCWNKRIDTVDKFRMRLSQATTMTVCTSPTWCKIKFYFRNSSNSNPIKFLQGSMSTTRTRWSHFCRWCWKIAFRKRTKIRRMGWSDSVICWSKFWKYYNYFAVQKRSNPHSRLKIQF